MDNTVEILVPISVGELFDKITILKIKQQKFTDNEKLFNVNKELSLLENHARLIDMSKIKQSIEELEQVNHLLWDIEDKKRMKEKEKNFDFEFIELSRSVYINNDKRAEIKKQINLITNSLIIEEKSYE